MPALDFLKVRNYQLRIFKMIGGSGLSKLLSFLTSIVVARIYSPDALGASSVVVAYYTVLAVFTNFRYNQAIVIANNERSALGLIHLCFLITVVISAAGFFGIVLIDSMFTELFQSNLFYLIPIAMLFTGAYETLVSWTVRQASFNNFIASSVLGSAMNGIYKIGFGMIGKAHAIHLIIGNLVGLATSIIMLFRRNLLPSLSELKSIKFDDIKKVATDYNDFPKFNLIVTLFGKLNNQLPLIILPFFYGDAMIGLFALTLLVIQQSVNLVGENTKKVYMQQLAKQIENGGRTSKSYWHTIKILSAIGIVPFLILTIAGPFIFTTVFGSEWTTSGHIGRVLGPWLFLWLLGKIATGTLVTLRMQPRLLTFHMIQTPLKALAILIPAFLQLEFEVVILYFSIVSSVGLIGLIMITAYFSNSFDHLRALDPKLDK